MAGLRAKARVDAFDLREYDDLFFSDAESSADEEGEKDLNLSRVSLQGLKEPNRGQGLNHGTSYSLPTKESGSLSVSGEDGRRTSTTTHGTGRALDVKLVKKPPCPIVPIKLTSIYLGRQAHLQRGLPSLVNLCVGVLGRHLEEIIDCAEMFVDVLPTSVRLSLGAIARRRGLLCDALLMALAEDSWDVLDVSRSTVTDEGMGYVAKLCPRLKAVDISHCRKLTWKSVEALVEHCPHLQTLRCGGDAASDAVVREAMWCLLPQLTAVTDTEALDWEDLDDAKVGSGAHSLVYLVWPTIDAASTALIKQECPKIVLIGKSPEPTPSTSTTTTPPKPSPSRVAGERSLPIEANPGVALDERFAESIDPSSWAVRADLEGEECGGQQGGEEAGRRELSIAERFRLAYISRDERLAPKRAKNARQMQRRVMRAWLKGDTDAKSRLLASVAERRLPRAFAK